MPTKIKNKGLPKGYLSFSAWKLWQTSQDSYYQKYILNAPDKNTEALARGKRFAEAQELKNGVYGEVNIECLTKNGLKLYGKLDFYDGNKIVDDKTSKNFKNIHKRSEEQILFYQLIIYRTDGRIVDGELHHWQTRDDMEILLGHEEIDSKPTVYPCKKPTKAKLLAYERKIERDAINIIKYLQWKSSK